MESKFAKVLDNRRVVVDLKRKRAARLKPFLSGASLNGASHLTGLKSSSLKLGKRKKPDVCRSRCRSCKLAPHRSLIRYTNFIKSGLPQRVMVYQNGGWVDHESEVIGVVRKEFEQKKAAIEVKRSGHHLVLDFVRMVQFNFKTALEQHMAWIDEAGCCFFPEVYADVDEQFGCHHFDKQSSDLSVPGQQETQEIKLQIDIELNTLGDSKVVEYCGESSPLVKRIKVGQNAEVEDSCDKVSDVRLNEFGENQLLGRKEDNGFGKADLNLNSETVKKMFLEGMSMIEGIDVVDTCSNSGPMWQGRLELFEKQAEITKKYRGNANICYAWLPSSKETASGIMSYGLGHYGLQQIKSSYGVGVHLAAARCADTSSNYCDVDENGVQYMVLCRVIMGNMEVIHAGSKQFHPSSENFDSGVDDLQNPQQYVVWSMNLNTHIYPEYVVTFRVPTTHEGCVFKSYGNSEVVGVKPVCESPFKPFKVRDEVNMESCGTPAYFQGSDYKSNVTCDGGKERTSSLNSTTQRAPKSPWMPFPVLLAAISKQVPASDMKILLGHYGQFKNKVISRDAFVKNLRLTVGDPLLKTTIIELHGKASPKDDAAAVE